MQCNIQTTDAKQLKIIDVLLSNNLEKFCYLVAEPPANEHGRVHVIPIWLCDEFNVQETHVNLKASYNSLIHLPDCENKAPEWVVQARSKVDKAWDRIIDPPNQKQAIFRMVERGEFTQVTPESHVALRSWKEIRGYETLLVDGAVGKVSGMLFHTRNYKVRSLLVKSDPDQPLDIIAQRWIDDISLPGKTVTVNLLRREINH